MTDIIFDIGDRFLMRVPAGVIDINYHITFGELSGFVCDPDGNKYILDGMYGIGEDKILRFLYRKENDRDFFEKPRLFYVRSYQQAKR